MITITKNIIGKKVEVILDRHKLQLHNKQIDQINTVYTIRVQAQNQVFIRGKSLSNSYMFSLDQILEIKERNGL